MKLSSQLCLLLFALCAPQALAADKAPISKSQAIKKAQQKVAGKVLKVEQTKQAYRVKVLQQNGRVKSVNVDKKSGSVGNK